MISNLETKSSKKLSEQLFSIFKKTIQEIEGVVQQAPNQIIESVHLTRKRLKFLRAFVKLTQFCNKEQNYKPLNYILRDCGRTISDCRDAHVRGLLLSEFAQHSTASVLIEELIILNDTVTKEFEKSLFSGINAFDELISDISSGQITGYFKSLEPVAECLASGYILGYEKSYHAFHSELRSHEADLLHEWRKRTKDLQYQQEALLVFLPHQLSPSYEQIVALCEILGRINDLFMFLEWSDSIKESIEAKDQFPVLKDILDQELNKLENQADKMGDLLFVLHPEEYARKLKQLIKS